MAGPGHWGKRETRAVPGRQGHTEGVKGCAGMVGGWVECRDWWQCSAASGANAFLWLGWVADKGWEGRVDPLGLSW